MCDGIEASLWWLALSRLVPAVGWDLPTPPLAFQSAAGSPALPPVRPNFLLDNCCTFREEPHRQQKAGKNLTAQNLCVVTDVQSSERFQCEFHRNAERWGKTAESQHRRTAHQTLPSSFDFWRESSSEGAVICAPQASGEGEAGLCVLRILEH